MDLTLDPMSLTALVVLKPLTWRVGIPKRLKMGNRHKLANILLISILLIASYVGCVSVKLPKNKTTKNADVVFTAPRHPFESNPTVESDATWKNAVNGNVISFHSSCFDQADPSIDVLQGELLQAFENGKILKSEPIEVSEREGRNIIAEGIVDGIRTQIEAVIFKKNECIYHLILAGPQKRFSENQSDFKNFVNGFRAP